MEVIKLSHKEFLRIDRNYEKTAKAADLIYVKDSDPGIGRVKKGKGFTYIYDGKPLKGKGQVERIRKLAVPPSWTNVWICTLANGHIQATGLDLRKRKQYRYHTLWNNLRNETKFHRMFEFGRILPQVRLRIEEDLRRKELCQELVLATLISLMERTYIRVGSNGYEKMYGSYGLTTLKDSHVEISGPKIVFSFTGKKGISHNITIRNKRLAKKVQACRDIPGKELFQYYDEAGTRKSIDSGMVNAYIKEVAGMDFTAKDFRTWAGSLHIMRAFKSLGEAMNDKECREKIASALDMVSEKLGNTRTVCRKYYVHPGVIRLFEENKLSTYLKELDKVEEPDNKSGLTNDELVLMKMLKSFH